MSEMPFLKFIVYTLFGSLIWNTVLICVGAFAGDKKDIILNVIDKTSNLILVLIVIVFAVFVYKFYKDRIKKINRQISKICFLCAIMVVGKI